MTARKRPGPEQQLALGGLGPALRRGPTRRAVLESIRAGRADGTLTRADNGALGGALRLAEALDVMRAGADYGTAFANVAGQFRHALTACGLTPAARASRDAESLDELDALLAGLDTPTAPRSTEAP